MILAIDELGQEQAQSLKIQLERALLPAVSAFMPAWKGAVSVAVCGAHLSGFPLNGQLHERGARMVAATRAAPKYRLYALPGGPPHRPGLARVESSGAMIEVEIWSVPVQEYGSFVAAIGSPLGIGTVEAEDGSTVQGFLCEAVAVQGARHHRLGWLARVAGVASGLISMAAQNACKYLHASIGLFLKVPGD